MRTRQKLFSVLVVLLAACVPWQMVSGSELDISGFFDVTSTYQNSQADENEYGLGQAEIDIESELSPTAAVAVAIAYNNEEGVFELGAAELGINLFSDENRFFTSVDVWN